MKKKAGKASSIMPVEKHNTAAWAGKEKKKPISEVIIPDEMNVEFAKEYADANEK
jgi:hypothetical protein